MFIRSSYKTVACCLKYRMVAQRVSEMRTSMFTQKSKHQYCCPCHIKTLTLLHFSCTRCKTHKCYSDALVNSMAY